MFAGIGTVVNVGAILVGGAIGAFLRKGFPERYKKTLNDALGLVVLFVGILGVVSGLLKVTPEGSLETGSIFILIASLIIGGLLGEFLNIEDKFNRLGITLQVRFSKDGDSRFSQGFVTSSLIFCIGAMAIVGAVEDALLGRADTLFAKSMLDGVMACILASSFGPGVLFSAFVVGIYQGAITILAGVIRPILTEVAIAQMSIVGGALITCIGTNTLGFTKIRIGNLLPAIFIPILWGIVLMFF